MAITRNTSVSGGGGGSSAVTGKSQLLSAISAYKRGLRTRPPIIFGLGDSNFCPDGPGDGATHYVNAFGKGPIDRIINTAPTLAGLPLKNTSWFGEGNMSVSAFAVSVTSFNPKLTLGGGWNMDNAAKFGIGGGWMRGDAPTVGYLQYSFGSSVNNVEIYFRTSTTDSASVGVYNSANTLITSFTCVAGAPGVNKITVSGTTFSDGIVKLRNNGAAFTRIAGMIAWDSTVPSILLVNTGFCAAPCAHFATATFAWDGLAFVPLIAPDCTILGLSINDIIAGTVRATYNTDLSYIANFVNNYGDVIISTCGNGSSANYLNGVSDGIAAEAKLVAAKFNAPFVDMQKEWVSWAATNAIGYELDAHHRTLAGYTDQGRVYGELLQSIIGS